VGNALNNDRTTLAASHHLNIERDDITRQSAEERFEPETPISAGEIAGPVTESRARAIQLEQSILRMSWRVFFYPQCWFDWKSLEHFAELCEVFICCDPSGSTEEFNQRIRALKSWEVLQSGPVDVNLLHLDQEPTNAAEFLNPGMLDLYRTELAQLRNNGQWGRCALLSRLSDGLCRRIYYFCAEPFTAYVQFFTTHNTAPKVLCLRGLDGLVAWTALDTWAGPLGRAVIHPPQPDILVGRGQDFPWNQQWRVFEDWPAVAYIHRQQSLLD